VAKNAFYEDPLSTIDPFAAIENVNLQKVHPKISPLTVYKSIEFFIYHNQKIKTTFRIKYYYYFWKVMRNFIGEFEEIVLLTIMKLGGEAYGVAIKKEMEESLSRTVSIGALHTALQRMTYKGLLVSKLGEATAERGGKKKRFFNVTEAGVQLLEKAKADRMKLWLAIPNFS